MLPILRIVGPSFVRIGWLAVYKLHNQYLQMHLLLHSVLAAIQMERSLRCQSIIDLIKNGQLSDLMIIYKPAMLCYDDT
jgi:hypothetical protein